MKELTIEEKAKRYDEALHKAKNYYSTTDSSSDIKLIGLIFPELKESEDERIRKAIHIYLDWLDGKKDYAPRGEYTINDMIDWIEKQGKHQKFRDSIQVGDKVTRNEDGVLVNLSQLNRVAKKQGEQKPTDKVEPKFREGDWVVYCNDDVDLITGIEENGYCINNGGYIPFVCENEMRLWDITDAKVGDVLVSESTCGLGTWYCIFKSLDGDESMTVYCYLSRDGRFETKKELCFDKDPYNTKPATKEQIDTLMKVMADAGYEWDAEKKELKNIEEEYNGEDYGIDGLYAAIDILQKTLGEVDGYQYDDGILTHKCAINAVKELSKQKPAWGEEDIELLDNTIKFIEDSVAATPPSLRTYSPTLTGKEIPFLKALKDRYTWRPSDEQMDALHYVTNFDYGGHKSTLVSLYEQLKKLK